MIKSLYSGVGGMRNHQVRMDVIANNISNVNTTAFKSGRVTFKDILSQSIDGNQVGRGMMVASIDSINTQGSLMNTGVATDLYIQGNGFFVVQDPNNTDTETSYYTRDGSFHYDEEGNLVNSMGYGVCDSDGNPITLTPPIDSISIDRTGQVIVNGDTDDPFAQIGLVQVNDLQKLTKEGENLYTYSGTDDPTLGVPGEEGMGEIISNNLELSNVDLTNEFTNMITTQRGYQSNAKIITTSDEMLQEILGLKR